MTDSVFVEKAREIVGRSEIDASWVATVSTWLGAFIQPTHWMPLPTPPKAGE